MLTKSDLKAIGQLIRKTIIEEAFTKEDSKVFATKKDLIGLARGTEIDDLKITFIDKLQEWKNELYNKIDPILSRVTVAEEENKILRARDEGKSEEREVLEERIKKLEDIHPHNRHVS